MVAHKLSLLAVFGVDLDIAAVLAIGHAVRANAADSVGGQMEALDALVARASVMGAVLAPVECETTVEALAKPVPLSVLAAVLLGLFVFGVCGGKKRESGESNEECFHL